ncbi:MAG TPA: HD-GYP domain-containing protein [Anaerolineales bacterium]|nr:HD-GYP domain-containing protein [Anaerolineales bacterium]
MTVRREESHSIFSLNNPTLWIVLPLVIYGFLRLPSALLEAGLPSPWPSYDVLLALPAHHFYIVSATALVALGISIVVGIIGLRQRNLQVIYVALAFISLAAFFSAHGLATPGFLIDQNQVVGVAAQLSVLAMSFWLLVSSLRSDNRISAWLARRTDILLAAWTIVIILAGILALSNPMLAGLLPINQAPLRYFAGGLTLIMAAVAGYRYWKSHRYSRFPFQLAVAYIGGWIAVTQIIISTGQTFWLSWWIYHFLLLASVIATVIGLVVQYQRGDSIVRSIVGLFSSNPSERLAAGISPSVRQLILETETRDPFTAGHMYRVAQGAFDLGRSLKLAPEELRVLAQGGIIHDVGKLQVPNEILNKPGPLTMDERRAIERHTVAGYELCARLGFMPPELAVIRSHHERPDGKGYPDKISVEQIPLLVKILSVVDVYDALTSPRSYRPAWPEAEALNYLQENRGAQFDAGLVDAWINMKNGKSEKPV